MGVLVQQKDPIKIENMKERTQESYKKRPKRKEGKRECVLVFSLCGRDYFCTPQSRGPVM